MTLDSRDLEAQVAAYWKVVASFAATQTPEALVRGAYIDGWLTGVYIDGPRRSGTEMRETQAWVEGERMKGQLEDAQAFEAYVQRFGDYRKAFEASKVAARSA